MGRNFKLLIIIGLFGLLCVACGSERSFDYSKELIGDWVTTLTYLLKPDEELLKLDKDGNLLGEIQDFRVDDTLNPHFENTFGMAVTSDGHIFWTDGYSLKGHF